MCNPSTPEVRWEAETGHEMHGMASPPCTVSKRLSQSNYKARLRLKVGHRPQRAHHSIPASIPTPHRHTHTRGEGRVVEGERKVMAIATNRNEIEKQQVWHTPDL